MAFALTDGVTAHTAPTLERTAHDLAQIRESIERMRVRVNAFHAHHGSLQRAAQGISTIHTHLESILQMHVAQHGWSSETHLAASALEATQQQLRLVLESDRAVPIEKQRACLNHALLRAAEALILTERNYTL